MSAGLTIVVLPVPAHALIMQERPLVLWPAGRGADKAEGFGRRNAGPGELVVRLHPTKVVAHGGGAD
ncbi:hypothetical protein [Streptomyces canus]|uniref:hypothetical protein n=1 Tax=Streptomyces canus TaxID=58343 RepID=UPI0027D7C51D|nr:hypothetical protein [Streptomyces canus]